MQILIAGPHPDDQELAMGGTVALLVEQGHSVTLLDFTNGEPTPFGNPEIRAREAAAAANVLGVNRLQAGFKNREVVHSLDARHRVAAIYRAVRPDILFLPYPEDAHPDHLAVTRIAEDARFDGKLTKSAIPGEPWYVPRVLYYFCTHLRFNFPATFCVDITGTMPRKLEALRQYQSQFYFGRTGPDHGAAERYVTNLCAYFGGTIRCDFAEPFFSKEMTGLRNLDALTL